jgi:hypothetical protein
MTFVSTDIEHIIVGWIVSVYYRWNDEGDDFEINILKTTKNRHIRVRSKTLGPKILVLFLLFTVVVCVLLAGTTCT